MSNNVRDFSQQANWINRQFKATIFSKDYITFIFVLLLCTCAVTASLMEVRFAGIALEDLKKEYKLANVYLTNLKKDRAVEALRFQELKNKVEGLKNE